MIEKQIKQEQEELQCEHEDLLIEDMLWVCANCGEEVDEVLPGEIEDMIADKQIDRELELDAGL